MVLFELLSYNQNFNILAPQSCGKNHFNCGKSCIPWRWVCDNDPDLDIRTGYRAYAQNGLNLKADYNLILDTHFRAGKLKCFIVIWIFFAWFHK